MNPVGAGLAPPEYRFAYLRGGRTKARPYRLW